MTHQSQKKWNVILNILLLINKSRDNSMGELLIRVYWSNCWKELGGEKKKVAASSNTSYVAGGNLPTFGFMIPQESGIRASGSLNDN